MGIINSKSQLSSCWVKFFHIPRTRVISCSFSKLNAKASSPPCQSLAATYSARLIKHVFFFVLALARTEPVNQSHKFRRKLGCQALACLRDVWSRKLVDFNTARWKLIIRSTFHAIIHLAQRRAITEAPDNIWDSSKHLYQLTSVDPVH